MAGSGGRALVLLAGLLVLVVGTPGRPATPTRWERLDVVGIGLAGLDGTRTGILDRTGDTAVVRATGGPGGVPGT